MDILEQNFEELPRHQCPTGRLDFSCVWGRPSCLPEDLLVVRCNLGGEDCPEVRDKTPSKLHHNPLGLRGPQIEVDGASNPVERSHHPAGQILGRAPQTAHRHPIIEGASRVEVMLGLPQTTDLCPPQDWWYGGVHRKNLCRLHGIAGRPHCMHLVPLHIVLVDHLVRWHAHRKHEGGSA